MTSPVSLKERDELFATVMLGDALGAVIEQHDDGSAPSMYDLDITYPDGRHAAAEVVSTRDRVAMSLAAATGRQPFTDVEALAETWFVMMRPEANVKALRRRLPSLLGDLERRGISRLSYRSFELSQLGLSQFGIASCWSTQKSERGPGFYLLSDWKFEWGGDGDDIVRRCEKFLSTVPDVAHKLQASGSQERHVVVLVTPDWVGPFGGVQYGPLPDLAPTLPNGVDRLWLVTLREPPIRAIYWLGDRWHETEVSVAY